MKSSNKLYGFALVIDDGMPAFMTDVEHHVTGYQSIEALVDAVEKHADEFNRAGYDKVRVFTYTAKDVDIQHIRSVMPPERCLHEYSEGYMRGTTVWRCTNSKGHKGWHSAGNRTWNSKGQLLEKN